MKHKIGRTENHATGSLWTHLEVKRSKVKITRSTNAEIGSASYFETVKVYEIQF